jgi:hypothetical protein
MSYQGSAGGRACVPVEEGTSSRYNVHEKCQLTGAGTEAGDRIVGLTATGRATVEAMNLKRPSLVKARQLWVQVGWHPPKEAAAPS